MAGWTAAIYIPFHVAVMKPGIKMGFTLPFSQILKPKPDQAMAGDAARPSLLLPFLALHHYYKETAVKWFLSPLSAAAHIVIHSCLWCRPPQVGSRQRFLRKVVQPASSQEPTMKLVFLG
jgi:hypothetical protein